MGPEQISKINGKLHVYGMALSIAIVVDVKWITSGTFINLMKLNNDM